MVKFEFGHGLMKADRYIYDIYIHLRNKQFRLEFGCGSMILDKVISLECWKNFEFSVSALILL
jgi:hypothetical protein